MCRGPLGPKRKSWIDVLLAVSMLWTDRKQPTTKEKQNQNHHSRDDYFPGWSALRTAASDIDSQPLHDSESRGKPCPCAGKKRHGDRGRLGGGWRDAGKSRLCREQVRWFNDRK